MKKLAVLIAVLFALTCLPLGSMANEDQDKIPNYMEEAQDSDAPIPNLTEETEGKNLNPVERTIIVRDTIQSNASTGINTGQ
jgi:hypothetical protein